MRARPTRAHFEIPGQTGERRVAVLGEERELMARDGTFADDFAGYAVHLYRVGGP